ncbi:MAG: anaerobic ribonucleoside-triphosphate reductase activating protein, partial [Duodenibacillus sp.]
MNYIGISAFDTANGPGVRVSLFVSGCRLHCPGCFNPQSWDFAAGKPYTDETQAKILASLEEEYVEGLSLLGGDPLEPENVEVLTELCRAVREKFGRTRTIWLWTGRRYEHVR